MQSILQVASDLLLTPADLDESRLQTLLNSMLTPHVDTADLYFQSSRSESWSLENSQVKSGSYSVERGVGIRAVSGDKTGYAYTDDIVWPAMEKAANAARSIALHSTSVQPVI